MNVEKKIVGEFLKQMRKRRGLTQLQVAREFGWTSAQFVSNWERGLSLPPQATLMDLVKLYEIPPSEVVKVFTIASKASLDEFLKEIKVL